MRREAGHHRTQQVELLSFIRQILVNGGYSHYQPSVVVSQHHTRARLQLESVF